MSGRFAHITRCLDLQEGDIAQAIGTREDTKALLAHLAALSAPDTGVAKALLLYARMATNACDWVDGDLCIELVGNMATTSIEACTELGGGLRERLFATTVFKAPLMEFDRAVHRVPHMIAPLVLRSTVSHRITLSATEAVRRTTAPPPPIEIARDSLFTRVAQPAAPPDATPIATQAMANPGLPIVDESQATHNRAPPGASEPPPDIDTGWDE